MTGKKYIVLSIQSNSHDAYSALGHEIHISRFILYDLLQNNFINNECIIVTLSSDRFFLYSNTFKNLLTWQEYKNNVVIDDEIIDLCYYSVWFTKDNVIDYFKKINYSFDMFEKTDRLAKYICDINYVDLTDYFNIINQNYILIHRRFTSKSNNINQIINTLKKFYKCPIVIFATDAQNIDQENIVVINNLQLFASFLNNPKCKLLISEWSGGGQLSQYCFNKTILYYFDNYPSNDYELRYEEYQELANQQKNIFICWDFKTTTSCIRKYYKTLDELVTNLNKFTDILN